MVLRILLTSYSRYSPGAKRCHFKLSSRHSFIFGGHLLIRLSKLHLILLLRWLMQLLNRIILGIWIICLYIWSLLSLISRFLTFIRRHCLLFDEHSIPGFTYRLLGSRFSCIHRLTKSITFATLILILHPNNLFLRYRSIAGEMSFIISIF